MAKKMNMKKVMKKVGKGTYVVGRITGSCVAGYGTEVALAAGCNAIIPGAGLVPVVAREGIKVAGFAMGYVFTSEMIEGTKREIVKQIKQEKKNHHKNYDEYEEVEEN